MTKSLKNLLGTICWVGPCLLYLWAVAGTPQVKGPNLWPPPDAEEYALLALRLAHGQVPLIGLGIHDYPSRYSLAFPVLAAPAVWITGGEGTRLWWAAAFFGLVAVALMARTGAWLLGSRWAGMLAAAFFALHPQTAMSGTTLMSETAILAMFFLLLEAARPWLGECGMRGNQNSESRIQNSESRIQNSESRIQNPEDRSQNSEDRIKNSEFRMIVRGAGVGVLLGWLTLIKAPFAWWAVGISAIVAARGIRRREWGVAAALIGTGLACAAGDLLYRRWAFGSWGMNGYQFWAPAFYTEFLKTFNVSYLWKAGVSVNNEGNLAYYGHLLLGQANEYYGRYMAPVALAGAAGLFGMWRGCKNTGNTPDGPNGMVLVLMAGWGAMGALFCGLYFFQASRFLYLWIPLVDLAAAAALARGPEWFAMLFHKTNFARPMLWSARVAGLLIALLILRGEYRRVRDIVHQPDHDVAMPVEAMRPLLGKVPAGAWLFTNYKPVTVELARANPGPTGSLYVSWLDGAWPLMNMHALGIDAQGLRPKRLRPAAAGLKNIPRSWENKEAELFGLDGSWRLTPEERRTFFTRPIYALIVRPDNPPDTGRYLDEKIMPQLKDAVNMEIAGEARTMEGKATLYLLKAH